MVFQGFNYNIIFNWFVLDGDEEDEPPTKKKKNIAGEAESTATEQSTEDESSSKIQVLFFPNWREHFLIRLFECFVGNTNTSIQHKLEAVTEYSPHSLVLLKTARTQTTTLTIMSVNKTWPQV